VTYLRLLPEIECWPTWIRKGKQFENVDPESLGITSELSAALNDWSDRWDSSYDLVDDPGNPKFSSDDSEREFWRAGTDMARRLRIELGPEWTIEYDPKPW
jgi:hypothetical protein